jgi:hypothetical protein
MLKSCEKTMRLFIDGGLWCLQMNPKSPDFKHKVTKKALWVDGWSTPPWVKVALKLVTLSKLPSHVGYHSSDSQKIVQANRY